MSLILGVLAKVECLLGFLLLFEVQVIIIVIPGELPIRWQLLGAYLSLQEVFSRRFRLLIFLSIGVSGKDKVRVRFDLLLLSSWCTRIMEESKGLTVTYPITLKYHLNSAAGTTLAQSLSLHHHVLHVYHLVAVLIFVLLTVIFLAANFRRLVFIRGLRGCWFLSFPSFIAFLDSKATEWVTTDIFVPTFLGIRLPLSLVPLAEDLQIL